MILPTFECTNHSPEMLYFFAMKNPVLLLWLPFLFSCENGQPSTKQSAAKNADLLKREVANPYVPVDLSPMDMAYFPEDFPVQKMNGTGKDLPVARVIYSRPHRQGRAVFGNIVKWGEPWRLGANEATEIQFFQPVTVQNKRIDSGRYIMYAIPYPGHWTVVFNTDLYTWGLKFNLAKDALKVDVPVAAKNQTVEYFSMVFEKTPDGADLVMAWESLEARLPIQF